MVWCLLVWFAVICRFIGANLYIFLCDLGVIWFGMIWCEFIEVWLGLSWYVFGVVWCLLVSFGVICTFLVVINVLV